MKLKTPNRPNYSRYAKLCDQTFYHDIQIPLNPPPNYEPPVLKDVHQKQQHLTTYGFTSISRQKKGNLDHYTRLPHGQFSHYPNHQFGKNRSPSWSFPKKQKFNKQQMIQYEVCERNPMFTDHEEANMKATTSSVKQLMKDKIKTMRSSGCMKSQQTKMTRNYSILQARQTSPVSFFNTSKIKNTRYFSKNDLNEMQSAADHKNYLRRAEPNPKWYIQFSKKKGRQRNFNSKGFQKFITPYSDEKQYNNINFTEHKIHSYRIDMNNHPQRPQLFTDKLGPNMAQQRISLDFSRRADNNINLLLSTFRNKITTRYDRVGQQPNTRLDYDSKEKQLPGMLEMNRMMARNEQLFPIVDPIIKKAGDKQMKQQLKKHIPIRQINEALRHKNVQNFGAMLHNST